MQVTFAGFTFDADRRLLSRGEVAVHLGPKAFDLLHMLLERRPKVVPKALIMERLWPGTFVGDNSLATLVNDLRTAVGDSARDPRIIRTSHGVGYAFVAAAADVPGPPSGSDRPLSDWLLVWDKTSLPLLAGENIIGRPGQGVIGIDAVTVSRQHARIIVSGELATVEDLGSKNGTWVGATRVTGTLVARHGDEIRFGLALVKLIRNASATSTQTAIDEIDDTHDLSRNS